jgi:hypothetical protein
MPSGHQISGGVDTKARGASKTQRDRILSVLIQARGTWVPLTEILPIAAQYGARIFELRKKLNFNIENRTQEVNGVRHSWFRLVPRPSSNLQLEEKDAQTTYSRCGGGKNDPGFEVQTPPLFGDISQQRYPD